MTIASRPRLETLANPAQHRLDALLDALSIVRRMSCPGVDGFAFHVLTGCPIASLTRGGTVHAVELVFTGLLDAASRSRRYRRPR